MNEKTMRCYHCTEDVTDAGRWQVEFDGHARELCCAGCEAVMQAIVESGLGDYYRFRTEPAQFGVIPDDLAASLDELAVFDEPEISERYLHGVPVAESAEGADLVDLSLAVEGLTCGACVWVLERSVVALPGVTRASVNFSSARATIRYDASRLKLSDILRRMTRMGYQSVPFDVRERELSLRRESRVFQQRLFVAGVATMQVMMYALPAYVSDQGEIALEFEQLLRWASLVLTTPVLVYSALPFLKGAWAELQRRQPGMDVPVSIGILAAFSASVWATITGSGEIYFDSVAMFVFLLLGARYLEWAARRRAMRAVDEISAAAPETAQRLVGDEVEVVPAVRVEEGDVLLVDNGARVPVDGVVLEGQSAVNNALVSGESVPLAVGPGDLLAGGALLAGAPIRLRVLRRQAASTLSVIDRLIDRGAGEKPRAVKIADRIATLFVSVLLGFTALVWLIWLQLDASRAATTAIAVLVVSCPCALSLATPAALAAATGALLRQRLLITRGHALETLAKVTDVVFDKTGTLTTGAPRLQAIRLADGQERLAVLRLAVALEIGSTHPYAQALRQALQKEESASNTDEKRREEGATSVSAVSAFYGTGDALVECRRLGHDVSHLEHLAGHGVAARAGAVVGGQAAGTGSLYLGSASWCGLSSFVEQQWQRQDSRVERSASEVYLARRCEGCEAQILARFLISDTLRDEVPPLLLLLKQQGLNVHLLSGDRVAAVQAVAESLAIEHVVAGVTPVEKQAYVARLQAKGARVLMVGDGINDAPVLASADVSMAAGDATALARTAADVISLQPGLEGLEPLLAKSVRTMNIVKQNLLWAGLYNVTAIPLAAMGYVPPWAAAIGMACSSLLVVINAQRLWSRHDRVTVGSIFSSEGR